jgi:taurine dioxygenase
MEQLMDVRRLCDKLPFGCMVVGLTAADICDEQVVHELNKLWIQHGLIVFRDGQCDADFQVDLSRCFGELQVHAVTEMLHPARDELFVAKTDGALLEVNGVVLGGYIPWHSDQVFTAQTNHGGVLRVAHQPEAGGATGFVDQIEAYDALPQAMKDRIAGLEVVYVMKAGPCANFRFLPRQQIRLIKDHPFQDKVNARIAEGGYPPVVHPLVFSQPQTGRKVLNLSPMFADRIVGMDPAESDALLWALADHLTHEERVYDHEWRPGDMVLWDNWRMIHCARGVPAGAYREVHRTSIAGDYALGRVLALEDACS